jgi:hypothetical protein
MTETSVIVRKDIKESTGPENLGIAPITGA